METVSIRNVTALLKIYKRYCNVSWSGQFQVHQRSNYVSIEIQLKITFYVIRGEYNSVINNVLIQCHDSVSLTCVLGSITSGCVCVPIISTCFDFYALDEVF